MRCYIRSQKSAQCAWDNLQWEKRNELLDPTVTAILDSKGYRVGNIG